MLRVSHLTDRGIFGIFSNTCHPLSLSLAIRMQSAQAFHPSPDYCWRYKENQALLVCPITFTEMKPFYPLTNRCNHSWIVSIACFLAYIMTDSFSVQILAQSAPLDSIGSIPLVYQFEHTGVDIAQPPLPRLDELPVVFPLTDPFEWSDGSGRVSDFNDWKRRRAEIKTEIEHYEIGKKPVRPELLAATFSDGLLSVEITRKG